MLLWIIILQTACYNITVLSPGGAPNGGDDRWDCQFRHRGLHIEKDHEYTVSYEITSDTDGQFYTKIGNLDSHIEDGLDAGEAWHSNGHIITESSISGTTETDVAYEDSWSPIKIKKGETLKVTATFTAQGTIQVGEWAFHLGGPGEITPEGCFKAGTKLSFDNMSIIDNTAEGTTDDGDYMPPFTRYQWKDIAVNQLGYIEGFEKHAVYAPSNGEYGIHRVSESGKDTVDFVIRQGDKTVYKGTSSRIRKDDDSGNYTYDLDFSDFNEEGQGYTVETEDCKSYPFSIGKGSGVYNGLLKDSLNFFYLNRSSVPIDEQYISASKYDDQITSANNNYVKGSACKKSSLAREAGHKEDTSYIQNKWIAQYKYDGSDVDLSQTQDVSGGWYNGADFGKSTANGGIAAWKLMNMYERSIASSNNNKYADSAMLLPENDNQIPDILDEVKYEIDFLRKMTVKDGEYEGMAYDRVKDFRNIGLAVTPSDSASDKSLYRIIKPPTAESTYILAAACAQFSRLYKDYDKDYADICLENAKTAYEAAKKNEDMICPLTYEQDQSRTDVNDDRYWAECELWLTTQDDNYLADMKADKHYLKLSETSDPDSDSPSLIEYQKNECGNLSLAANTKLLDDEMASQLKKNITDTADSYIEMVNNQGYGIPFAQQKMFYRPDSDSTAMISGYPLGSNADILSNAEILATAYNMTNENKYADGALSAMDYLFGKNANEVSYVTGYGTYHTTFVNSKFWSAQIDAGQFPLAPSGVLASGPNSLVGDQYIRSFGYSPDRYAPQRCYVDNVESWSTNECSIEYNASLAWMADFADQITESEIIYGDFDNSGVVDMTDLTALSQKLLGDIKFDSKQIIAADVNGDSKVDIADLAHLKQYVMLEKVILGPNR